MAILSAFAAAALAASCMSSPLSPGLSDGPPCETRGSDLLLRGMIDEGMVTCVKAVAAPPQRIIVDSEGGYVPEALQVGEIIAGWRTEIVVDGICNSSCANYVLPVARRVVLQPGAMVSLHGSVDPLRVSRGGSQATADLQAAYAERHGIHRGWLMYRTVEDGLSRFPYFTGQQEVMADSQGRRRAAYLLVEESLMRSCLTRVDIPPWSDTLAQRARADIKVAQHLANEGTQLSGSAACRPEPPREPKP